MMQLARIVILAVIFSAPGFTYGQPVVDAHGAMIRGDVTQRALTLVLTGDEFGEGLQTIRKTLKRHNVPAAFFLTGNFYANPAYKDLTSALRKDGHYLGAHSDKHLLYADWTRRDSLLVTQDEFKQDLLANYARMRAFGIEKEDAPYFLPPYEWYNKTIASWTSELGLQLINFSPGTRSHADYTYPEMGDRYVSSENIYKSILDFETRSKNGLNGFILLMHVGTDPRRKDKFYNRLDDLLTEIESRGYKFISLQSLLTTNN